MKMLLNFLFLTYFYSALVGCSNENVWQSLKSRENIVNPSAEPKRISDKPDSYQDYVQDRNALLNDTVKK